MSTNNEEVYALLESSGNMLSVFSADRALLFEQEDDCYVVLFSASSRNFCSFRAENYLQQTDALPSLLSKVQDHPEPGFSPDLIAAAVRLIEDKLHSKNNSRFFFDAH